MAVVEYLIFLQIDILYKEYKIYFLVDIFEKNPLEALCEAN